MGVKDPLMLIFRVVLYFCPPGYLDVLGCRIIVTNTKSKICNEHVQCVVFTGATMRTGHSMVKPPPYMMTTVLQLSFLDWAKL